MPKEEIYTIPVIDAFKEDCECVLCRLYQKLEDESLDFVLGPSYMESDVRMATNEKGFCQRHYTMLYARPNRLGVALIMETHMKEIRDHLKKLSKKSPKASRFSLRKQEASGMTDYTGPLMVDCYICSRIDGFFTRYLDTLFYLWKKEPSFVEQFNNSKGFCVKHFGQLYDLAPNHLNQKQLEEFISVLVQLQEENFERVIGDIEWFITKFDYRFEKEPWKNSKDAIIRSIEKVASLKVQS